MAPLVCAVWGRLEGIAVSFPDPRSRPCSSLFSRGFALAFWEEALKVPFPLLLGVTSAGEAAAPPASTVGPEEERETRGPFKTSVAQTQSEIVSGLSLCVFVFTVCSPRPVVSPLQVGVCGGGVAMSDDDSRASTSSSSSSSSNQQTEKETSTPKKKESKVSMSKNSKLLSTSAKRWGCSQFSHWVAASSSSFYFAPLPQCSLAAPIPRL